jgi:hypothetical protein
MFRRRAVQFFENGVTSFNLPPRQAATQKCVFKGIDVPTFATIAVATDELVGEWTNMLGHQLPTLPPFESFWRALPEFFAWLESGAAGSRRGGARHHRRRDRPPGRGCTAP